MFVSLTGTCGANVSSTSGSCYAAWGIYPDLARITQGILLLIVILLISLIVFDYPRNLGLYQEPTSIASLATLYYKSQLQQELEFRNLDVGIGDEELKEVFAGKKYKIGRFTAKDGTECYGFVTLSTNPDPPQAIERVNSAEPVVSTSSLLRVSPSSPSNPNRRVPTSPATVQHASSQYKLRHMWNQIKESVLHVFCFSIIGSLLCILGYYRWKSSNTGFERFTDGTGLGVRLLLTSTGVLIKLLWSNIDQSKHYSTPYPLTLSPNHEN